MVAIYSVEIFWNKNVKVLGEQLCATLCDPMDCSLPGFSVHGIVQARILTGLPCPPRGDLPDPGIEHASASTALAGGFFTISTSGLWTK